MTTMVKQKKQFRSYNQAELKLICDNLCDNIETLFETFNLEARLNNKMYTMCCPIHGGDNPSAFNIYHMGDNYRGNWTCRTHGCEKTFKPSIIGFVRALLSIEKYDWHPGEDSKLCPFNEAVEFSLNLLNKNLKDFKVSKVLQEKNRFSQIVEKITNKNETLTKALRREYAIATLKIPAKYYLDRNYSEDILKKYDVGLCDRPGKEMSGRVVVPIYDNTHQYVVGCSGRSIYSQCEQCSAYHDPNGSCPSESMRWVYSKWRHSKDLKSQNHLYNYWFAKEHIMKTSSAIIVESPGNVWRLEEAGIHNSVGIFGSSLSDRQKIILDGSGAMNIIILADNDDAGKKAAQQIKKKCEKTYNIYIAQITKTDIGEMSVEEIKSEIKPFLEKIV
jgi:5S rRNA maturation endonuclease (ribonuclease M5)